MKTTLQSNCTFTIETEGADEFKRYLQGILNEYHEMAYPLMETVHSRRFTIRVKDESGETIGGALFWAYWGWIDVSLIALEEGMRGRGLGRRLMALIEDKAREESCHKIRVETFEHEVGFYQDLGYRVVGHLEDYPEGYNYYWMRKDLRAE